VGVEKGSPSSPPPRRSSVAGFGDGHGGGVGEVHAGRRPPEGLRRQTRPDGEELEESCRSPPISLDPTQGSWRSSHLVPRPAADAYAREIAGKR
jgi:hypothetical protein